MKYSRLAGIAMFIAALAANGAQSAQFRDSRGTEVSVKLGSIAFADRSVTANNPDKLRPGIADPDNALSVPNYKAVKDNGTYYSLGCKGSVVWEFSDNTLTDVPGDDLYLFEVGPDIEPTLVDISADGSNWISLGTVEGGKASVDIASAVRPGDVFRFVRLTDLGKACRSRSPGADIDAIAAIGAGLTYRLDSSVLFDYDSHILKSAARAAISEVVGSIENPNGVRIIVTGHTDSDGSEAYNFELSQNRAQAVTEYILANSGLSPAQIQSFGRGEEVPIASNATEAAKARNRRVEITIVPK